MTPAEISFQVSLCMIGKVGVVIILLWMRTAIGPLVLEQMCSVPVEYMNIIFQVIFSSVIKIFYVSINLHWTKVQCSCTIVLKVEADCVLLLRVIMGK